MGVPPLAASPWPRPGAAGSPGCGSLSGRRGAARGAHPGPAEPEPRPPPPLSPGEPRSRAFGPQLRGRRRPQAVSAEVSAGSGSPGEGPHGVGVGPPRPPASPSSSSRPRPAARAALCTAGRRSMVAAATGPRAGRRGTGWGGGLEPGGGAGSHLHRSPRRHLSGSSGGTKWPLQPSAAGARRRVGKCSPLSRPTPQGGDEAVTVKTTPPKSPRAALGDPVA